MIEVREVYISVGYFDNIKTSNETRVVFSSLNRMLPLDNDLSYSWHFQSQDLHFWI